MLFISKKGKKDVRTFFGTLKKKEGMGRLKKLPGKGKIKT